MPVCPTCHAAYYDGQVECIDCGVALVDDDDELQDEDDLVEAKFIAFRTYPTRVHAEMIVEALAHEGIPAIIKSDEFFGSGTGIGTGGPHKIVVWIPTDQLTAATEIADGTLDHL